jgi:hypothetical protein
VLDLFSRQVVGWSMRGHMQASAVTDALRMAWFRRRPTSDEARADEAKRQLMGLYPQQLRCCWIGGHFTEPKEQNTQQSPGLGRSSVLQRLHS